MTCNDCLYYEVCPLGLAIKGVTRTCLKFKNKADVVEVVRCKNCKSFKHIQTDDWDTHICKTYGGIVTEEDYCSRYEVD